MKPRAAPRSDARSSEIALVTDGGAAAIREDLIAYERWETAFAEFQSAPERLALRRAAVSAAAPRGY